MLTYTSTLAAARARSPRRAPARSAARAVWPCPPRRRAPLPPGLSAAAALARYGPARRARILARLAAMLTGTRGLPLAAALAQVNRA